MEQSVVKAPGSDQLKRSESSRRILIPVGAGTDSRQALIWYGDNIKHHGDLIIFVHIIDPVFPTHLSALSIEHESMLFVSSFCIPDGELRTAKSICQQLVREASKLGVNSEALIQIDTKPGPALVKLISEKKIDIVVMPNRGLGFWRCNFIGSVSSYILHHSNIPVSIVPSSYNHS
ncbi:unnamed protein product [Heterobilharzia americana]|nr:unnamed protein product [Heterobilharzia americana]CAH8595038.1 unnamed protein product [Heterobilharzia americana]